MMILNKILKWRCLSFNPSKGKPNQQHFSHKPPHSIPNPPNQTLPKTLPSSPDPNLRQRPLLHIPITPVPAPPSHSYAPRCAGDGHTTLARLISALAQIQISIRQRTSATFLTLSLANLRAKTECGFICIQARVWM